MYPQYLSVSYRLDFAIVIGTRYDFTTQGLKRCAYFYHKCVRYTEVPKIIGYSTFGGFLVIREINQQVRSPAPVPVPVDRWDPLMTVPDLDFFWGASPDTAPIPVFFCPNNTWSDRTGPPRSPGGFTCGSPELNTKV